MGEEEDESEGVECRDDEEVVEGNGEEKGKEKGGSEKKAKKRKRKKNGEIKKRISSNIEEGESVDTPLEDKLKEEQSKLIRMRL